MSEYGKIDVNLENGVFTIEIGGLDGDTHRGISRAFRAAHDSDARCRIPSPRPPRRRQKANERLTSCPGTKAALRRMSRRLDQRHPT